MSKERIKDVLDISKCMTFNVTVQSAVTSSLKWLHRFHIAAW